MDDVTWLMFPLVQAINQAYTNINIPTWHNTSMSASGYKYGS